MSTEELIPENTEGAQSNTESSKELDSEKEAGAFLRVVIRRLLDVNHWHQLGGKASASFQLTNDTGMNLERSAAPGDLFRINIPAPGNASGDGDDWVRIESIEETDDGVVMQVRPCPNPMNTDADIAHFFSDAATSSFVAKREGKKVIAGVYGRNEKPNTDTSSITDKIRNTAVALGAISGLSKLQWKSLTAGLMEKE